MTDGRDDRKWYQKCQVDQYGIGITASKPCRGKTSSWVDVIKIGQIQPVLKPIKSHIIYLYGEVILYYNLCVYAFENSPFTNWYLNKQNCFFNPIRANWTKKISFLNCMIGFCIKTLYQSQNWPYIISSGRKIGAALPAHKGNISGSM